jgi:hypothetical protein
VGERVSADAGHAQKGRKRPFNEGMHRPARETGPKAQARPGEGREGRPGRKDDAPEGTRPTGAEAGRIPTYRIRIRKPGGESQADL